MASLPPELVQEVTREFERQGRAVRVLKELHISYTRIEANLFNMLREIPAEHMPHRNDLAPLLQKEDSATIQRLTAGARPGVMLFGPNSSGKSSLTNILLGAPLMPTGAGYVTARVSRLSFAPADQACIKFARLNASGTALEPTGDPPIALKGLTPLQARKQIQDQLKRDKAPQDANAKLQWQKTVVEVYWPSPILSAGFDLYDLPGTSQADSAEVQQYLDSFVVAIQPLPLFIYNNSTVSDDEMLAAERLSASLRSTLQGGEVFFISSYFDIESLRADNSYGPPVDLNAPDAQAQLLARMEKEVRTRFNRLRQRPIGSALPNDGSDGMSSPFFACVGALDFLDRANAQPAARHVSELLMSTFVHKLVKFSARASTKRLMTGFSKLLAAVSAFFHMNALQGKKTSDVAKSYSEALAILQAMKDELVKQLLAVLLVLPIQVAEHARKPRVRAAALQYAASVKLEQENGLPGVLKLPRPQAVGACKTYMQTWINENVIGAVTQNVQDQVISKLREAIKKHLDSAQRNEIVMNSLLNELNAFNVNEGYFDYLSRKLNSSLIGSVVGVLLAPVMALWFKVFHENEVIAVTPEFKQSVMNSMLDFVAEKLEKNELLAKVADEATDFICSLVAQVKASSERAQKLAAGGVAASRVISGHQAHFAELGCRILQARCELEYAEPPRIEPEPFAHGGGGQVHHATWGNRRVVAKCALSAPICVKLGRDPESSVHEFNIEVIQAWKITELLRGESNNILPLLGLYFVNNRFFALFPVCKEDLTKYLDREMPNITVPQSLELMSQITGAVKTMHAHNIIHRDIKALNIFIVPQPGQPVPQLLLGDWGTITTASEAVTKIGTPLYMAPEIHGSSYNSKADIWSLVLVLIEMSPKAHYAPVQFTDDGLSAPISPDLWPPLRDFLVSCIKLDPEERPTAQQILDKLGELKVQAQAAFGNQGAAQQQQQRPAPFKSCLICLSRPREVRLACGHGVLCQTCLATVRSRGNKCPVCRQTIEKVYGIGNNSTFIPPKP